MPKDQTEILIEEFTAAKDRWLDMRMQLMMRFGDQRMNIGDRRFNLNIALVSIAAAFLTIVVPLVGVNFSVDFILATICFFICTTIGVFDILWTIRCDQLSLAADNRWRIQVLKEHEAEAERIRSLLLKGEVPEKDIRSYFGSEENIIMKMRQRSLDGKNLWTRRILSTIQYIFLFSFFVGFIFLAIAIFPEFKPIRF